MADVYPEYTGDDYEQRAAAQAAFQSKLVQAMKDYAPVEEYQLSPTGRALTLKEAIPIVGTPYTLHEGHYPLLDYAGHLGMIDLDALNASFMNIVDSKKQAGEYVEEEHDGVTTFETTGDAELSIDIVPVEVNGRYITVSEVLVILAAMHADTEEETKEILDTWYVPQVTEQPEKVEAVTLAQFDIESGFLNHSLAMKVLNGLVQIAYGEPSYELKPRSGKSGERYVLTGSTENSAKFFAEDGGNVQILSLILETVHNLITDKRAEGFAYQGRVWFSVTKILEEALRTAGGTIEGRHNVNRKLVDDALTAVSGAQIKGTNPAGEPLNVEYFVNAVRRDRVIHNGNEYRDVWGFALNGWTIHDYAKELNQAYSYPLLATGEHLTLQQQAVARYLKDKAHEARGKLYTKTGKKSKTSTCVQELSWDSIFTEFYPIGEIDSRKKNKLVGDFDKVLKILARQDASGELHEGRPLYIDAHSVRDSGRGRGKGAWRKLVITYSNKPKNGARIELL